jgi:aspartate aminotransferase
VGAFYFFFRVDSFFSDDVTSGAAFCERLMSEEGVAIVPGDAFGDKRWARLSFAAADRDIQRALERIGRFAGRIGGRWKSGGQADGRTGGR